MFSCFVDFSRCFVDTIREESAGAIIEKCLIAKSEFGVVWKKFTSFISFDFHWFSQSSNKYNQFYSSGPDCCSTIIIIIIIMFAFRSQINVDQFTRDSLWFKVLAIFLQMYFVFYYYYVLLMCFFLFIRRREIQHR